MRRKANGFDGEYYRASKLFKSFFKRAPQGNDILQWADTGEYVLNLGELDGIIYRIDGEPDPLIHRFSKTHRPLLLVSSDGRQIYSVRGRYRFTAQGFKG